MSLDSYQTLMDRSIENLVSLVELQLGARRVTPRDRLMEDLEAESVDIVNLLVAIEEDFVVVIDDADMAAVSTIDDLWQLVQRAAAAGG